MRFLRQSTAATAIVGPFLDKTDGVTPRTALADQSAVGRLVKAGTGGAFAAASWAHDALGHYLVGLSTAHADTLGRLRLSFSDPTTYAPVWEDFTVLSAAVYDSLFAVTSRSTYAGADTSGTGTLLARLTATRAGYLDALAGLIALDSGAVAAGTSATVFTSTSGGLNATSGAYTGQTLIFTTGANKGERRTISTHTLSTGTHTFTLSAALTATPSAADAFVIA
jgi:hypothetical protein